MTVQNIVVNSFELLSRDHAVEYDKWMFLLYVDHVVRHHVRYETTLTPRTLVLLGVFLFLYFFFCIFLIFSIFP